MSKHSIGSDQIPVPEYNIDPRIVVQKFVIEKLNLAEEFNAAAVLYVDEGYAQACRTFMQTNGDVQSFLQSHRFEEASILLTSLLHQWKKNQPSSLKVA